MVCISTFVFFDIETTGLPFQERNRTKIIELSFVAVTRSDIVRNMNTVPPVSKLTLLFNPQKTIHSAAITGLTNDILKYSPIFKEKFNTIKTFLEDLKKPVCLVAHNGNSFDYKILLAECMDANVRLPDDLLCGDSLPYFKQLYSTNTPIPKPVQQEIIEPEFTDDEDEWPELNVTPEDLQEIDDLCSSLSDISCKSDDNNSKNKKTKPKKDKMKNVKVSYKLTDIYKRLLGKEPENAHRAEGDCLMLLQCARAQYSYDDNEFVKWMDNNCKPLDQIIPLIRK